ncbi:MAG: tRNA pseudouridine(55) synthase TruB [Bacteroidota bacterium]
MQSDSTKDYDESVNGSETENLNGEIGKHAVNISETGSNAAGNAEVPKAGTGHTSGEIKQEVTVPDFEAGQILLIDKPLRWTSFDVVKKIRNTIRTKKVGHAGTLDPLATGLLILCTGKFTKQIESLMGQAKVYTGEIKLGFTTPSFDAESDEEFAGETSHISPDMLEAAAVKFRGDIMQVPPLYSAIRIDGKRGYELARRGKDAEMVARPVTMYEFEITEVEMPFVRFRIKCSKGTYIRSIANDFGAELGCGGYLTALRRTHIGDYNVDDAWQVSDFVSAYGRKPKTEAGTGSNGESIDKVNKPGNDFRHIKRT